jgi:hypothetical protein
MTQVAEVQTNGIMAPPLLDSNREKNVFVYAVFDNVCLFFSTLSCSSPPILMSEHPDKDQKRTTIEHDEKPKHDAHTTVTAPETVGHSQNVYAGLKVIPWSEIWASVAAAKLRGNTEMLKVFYDTLYKEAVFDDRGVWVLNSRPRS